MIDSELVELAAWAELQLPRLIDEACAVTVERIPFYRDEQIVPPDELRTSVEENVHEIAQSRTGISPPYQSLADTPRALHLSADNAAESLYCHPNTVRYRLRRLQELTGRSLVEPRGVAELAAAAYAIRLNPAAAMPRRVVAADKPA